MLLQLLLKREKFAHETFERAEIFLLEQDDFVDARIHFEQFETPRFDDPSDLRVGDSFFNRVADGQGVNHVAERAELNDQNVLQTFAHDDFASKIFLTMLVVE